MIRLLVKFFQGNFFQQTLEFFDLKKSPYETKKLKINQKYVKAWREKS